MALIVVITVELILISNICHLFVLQKGGSFHLGMSHGVVLVAFVDNEDGVP